MTQQEMREKLHQTLIETPELRRPMIDRLNELGLPDTGLKIVSVVTQDTENGQWYSDTTLTEDEEDY